MYDLLRKWSHWWNRNPSCQRKNIWKPFQQAMSVGMYHTGPTSSRSSTHLSNLCWIVGWKWDYSRGLVLLSNANLSPFESFFKAESDKAFCISFGWYKRNEKFQVWRVLWFSSFIEFFWLCKFNYFGFSFLCFSWKSFPSLSDHSSKAYPL